MKKSLIRFIVILVGLFAILSLLDARGNYVAEQIIWKANKQLRNAMQSPAAIPDNAYEQISDMYRKVIQKFPDSPLAPRAHILLGRVDIVRKSYDTARQKLNVVFDKYPKDENVCSEAAAEIAKTYEMEGDWKKALAVYNKIVHDYPTASVGLMTPLYVANHYKSLNDTLNATNAYDNAIEHYAKITQEHKNSLIEFKALRLLSNCYIAQQKWRLAINTMGDVLIKYPEARNAASTIKAINTIVLTQAQYADDAISIYRNFIERHSRHPINKLLNSMIIRLKEIKDKNVQIVPKDNGDN